MGRFLVVITSVFIVVISCVRAEALSLNLNLYSVDFGNMNMGDIKTEVPAQGLTVTATTSAATAGWTLKIRNEEPFRHQLNPASVIPNTQFRWYAVSTTGSESRFTYPINQREDFTYEKLIYTGVAGEEETDITLKFELALPPILQSGTYTTRVIFTLTE